jgi:hypothetical protein
MKWSGEPSGDRAKCDRVNALIVRTSTLYFGADQVFGEIGRATVRVVHNNDVRKLEEGIECENVVHGVLRMACNDTNNDGLSRVQPEDLLRKDSRVGAANDHDFDGVQLESLHLREGRQRGVSSHMLLVPRHELGDRNGSH